MQDLIGKRLKKNGDSSKLSQKQSFTVVHRERPAAGHGKVGMVQTDAHAPFALC
jgi:hypothetical protein